MILSYSVCFIQLIYLLRQMINLPKSQQEREALLLKIQNAINTLSNQKSQEVSHKLNILRQRMILIKSATELTQKRLTNLQKIFKHYSSHIFKAGKHISFDRIVYENQHLTMERFFGFLLDFKLNEIIVQNSSKPIMDRNDIILNFKKSSSNARNLEFSQFISCLQRLFVLLFDSRQNYFDRQEQVRQQKIKRLQEMKKRQQRKLQKIKNRQKKEENKINGEFERVKDQQGKEENDDMMKQLMKNPNLKNPTDEITKSIRQTQKNKMRDVKSSNVDDIYTFTNEQKVEKYLQMLNIDNIKEIQKRLRHFEKNRDDSQILEQKYEQRRQKELLQVSTLISNKSKVDPLEQNNKKRLKDLKQKITAREDEKNKSILKKTLSEQNYALKKSKLDNKYFARQKREVKPEVIELMTRRKKDKQTVYYSLNMVHQSSADQLKIKPSSIAKYLTPDETDKIFMDQYNALDTFKSARYRAASEISKHNNKVVDSARKRALQVENQQKKIEDYNKDRFVIQAYKHKNYLQKFLQRKW